MSTPEGYGGKEVTLAIRIDTARHAQLTWIAELRGTSLKAECFKAVDAYIEAAKQDSELMAKADAARAAIEAEAKARQDAIANLFTATPPPPPEQEEVSESEATEAEVEADEVGATAGEPPQGNRRGRGRRGGQQMEGEGQPDS
ncbi:hypothetical protein [Nocardia vinacea]|uniref:hypothetical protein n=1 Tax=Nocardia vinacea TaxID=96468 RepID=UPI0002D725BA|nr:hypothetical protein [Nocardia vinacea]